MFEQVTGAPWPDDLEFADRLWSYKLYQRTQYQISWWRDGKQIVVIDFDSAGTQLYAIEACLSPGSMTGRKLKRVRTKAQNPIVVAKKAIRKASKEFEKWRSRAT
jgi:hypothetical protein